MATKKSAQSAEEFTALYIERAGLDAQHFVDLDRGPAEECDCGATECTGWQMPHPADPGHKYHLPAA